MKKHKVHMVHMLKRSTFVQMATQLEEALDLLTSLYYGGSVDELNLKIRAVLREAGWIDKDD